MTGGGGVGQRIAKNRDAIGVIGNGGIEGCARVEEFRRAVEVVGDGRTKGIRLLEE